MHAIVSYTTTDSVDKQEHNYKHYVHFFYKFRAIPPFKIIQLSAPIPLRVGKSRAIWFGTRDHAYTAFVSGFEWLPLRPHSGTSPHCKGDHFTTASNTVLQSSSSHPLPRSRSTNRRRIEYEKSVQFLIAYGYADRSARTLIMTLDDINLLFLEH